MSSEEVCGDIERDVLPAMCVMLVELSRSKYVSLLSWYLYSWLTVAPTHFQQVLAIEWLQQTVVRLLQFQGHPSVKSLLPKLSQLIKENLKPSEASGCKADQDKLVAVLSIWSNF